jgi:molecular chaperone DnaK (HSP70)
MNRNMSLRIAKAYKNVGKREGAEDYPASAFVDWPPEGRFLLVLYWPEGWKDLAIDARRLPGGRGAPEPFASGPVEVAAMVRACGLGLEHMPEAIHTSQLLACELTRDDRVHFSVAVDTDHEDYVRACDALTREPEKVLHRDVEYLALAKRRASGAEPAHGVGKIRIELADTGLMGLYKGLVAIDFGTTTSTLAYLPDRAPEAEMLNLVEELKEIAGRSIPSALWIQSYGRAPKDVFEKVTYHIGPQALMATLSESPEDYPLILGPKRLMVDASGCRSYPRKIGKETHDLDIRLPAELFLARLFRVFHTKKLSVPRRVVVTCPTTFSQWEADRLRETVRMAWVRASKMSSRAVARDAKLADLPMEVIDEASAAAFYFLHRDALNVPGGANALAYTHPLGMNILVFDCGGGTTDVALVHARVERGSSKGAREPVPRLVLEVLGRTGHRGFGGDDITIAVFKVLKAKIATRLRPSADFSYPDTAGEVEAFLDLHASKIEAAVPTKENSSPLLDRIRENLVLNLWEWAEQLKKGLRTHDGEEDFRVPLDEFSIAVINHLANAHDIGRDEVQRKLERIGANRAEVDILVRKELDKAIGATNNMLAAKGARGKIPGDEVHAVYVVGSASLYPLVEERLKSELAVRFLDQRIQPVQDDERKNAVAKGAALAAQMDKNFQFLELDLAGRRNNRLAHDVAVPDLRSGGRRDPSGYRLMFAEDEPYELLRSRPFSVQNRERGDDPIRQRNQIDLYRRWPGDENYHPFLVFTFSKPIEGPTVSLWFDMARQSFYMRDEGTLEEVRGEGFPTAMYRAPQQGGLI